MLHEGWKNYHDFSAARQIYHGFASFLPEWKYLALEFSKKCKSIAKYLESKTDVYRKKLSGSRKKIGIIQSRTPIYDL